MTSNINWIMQDEQMQRVKPNEVKNKHHLLKVTGHERN
jgi:hypothetical protein